LGKCWGKLYIRGANNQLLIKMATIKFKTYGKGKENAPIYIRFSNGRDIKNDKGETIRRNNFEIKSGIVIPNTDFFANGKTRKVAAFINQPEVQTKLDGLRAHISAQLHNSPQYSKEWLQDVVNDFNGIVKVNADTVPTLCDMIEQYIEHIETTIEDIRKVGTVKTYKVTISRITAFQEHIGRVYHINEIDREFKAAFTKWARQVAKYKNETFIKSLRQVKTVVRYAADLKHPVNEDFLKITIKAPKTQNAESDIKSPYLSTDEIERIMNFKGHDHLENARDWLVISCWTGCRVSDLMELTTDNIHTTINGDKAIRYTQQKTGDKVLTPYHFHVAQIIDRNGGFPRAISHQRYNDYIKELCRLVGITEMIEGTKMNPETRRKESGKYPKYELVTSHIGRRSFATNHYGKLPTHMIMLVTGHDTVKQFLDYVGEHPEAHITALNEYYRNMEQEKVVSSETSHIDQYVAI